MALVCWRRESLALEDMAEMAAAVGANDLGPRHAQSVIHVLRHCPWKAVEISRPPAAGLELVARLIQGRAAAGTGVDALAGVVLIILSRAGRFSPFFPQNTELFYEEFVSCIRVNAELVLCFSLFFSPF